MANNKPVRKQMASPAVNSYEDEDEEDVNSYEPEESVNSYGQNESVTETVNRKSVNSSEKQPVNINTRRNGSVNSNNAGGSTTVNTEPDWDTIDFDKLLERHFPKQSWRDRKPEEVFGPAITWGGYILGGLVKPINYFLDGGQQEELPPGQAEYMSFLKRMLYQVGGAAIWAWSAFLTQAVTSRVYPLVDKALGQESAGGFFQHGLTISLKAIIASAIFTFMLSVIETMLYDKNKGPGKKLLILLTFLVDIAVNALAYADFLGHSKQFEWMPLITVFRGKEIEWGSVLIMFAAILNAALPELMWEKARRARKVAKAAKERSKNPNERGMWLGNKWYSESELRAIAKQRRKVGR